MIKRTALVCMILLALTVCAAAEVALTALQLPEGKGLHVKFTPTKRAPAKATTGTRLVAERFAFYPKVLRTAR